MTCTVVGNNCSTELVEYALRPTTIVVAVGETKNVKGRYGEVSLHGVRAGPQRADW